MGRKDNPGGTQVIGPGDVGWFGNGDVNGGKRDDAAAIERRKTSPLTAQAQKRIFDLRVDVAGLRREIDLQLGVLKTLRQKVARSEGDLADLLHCHGLPLDKGLSRPTQNHGPNLAKRARAVTRGKTKPKATT